MRPPGSRALAFASQWFDPATVHRTFEPLVADWQREWLDAPRLRRIIVRIKGLLAFGVAAVICVPAIARTRSPKSLTARVTRRIAWTTAAGTAILMVPFFREIEPSWLRGLLILFAIPQAMTLAFPFAMIAAVDAIRNTEGIAPHVLRASTAKLAGFAIVFVTFTHGWVVPTANQAWREARFRAEVTARGADSDFARYSRGPAKGLRELTTYELITATQLAAGHETGRYVEPVIQAGPAVFDLKSVRAEIHNRATLAVLPVFLLWRRWRALDLPAKRWFSARHSSIATIVVMVAFVALRGFFNSVEAAWHLPAGSGAWVELGFLAMLGMTRVWLVERTVARA